MFLISRNTNSFDKNCLQLSLTSFVGFPNLKTTVDKKFVIPEVVTGEVQATSGHLVYWSISETA